MNDFHVGDKVKCVDTNFGIYMSKNKRPNWTDTYTIRAFNPVGLILLNEIINDIAPNRTHEAGFAKTRFVKVK